MDPGFLSPKRVSSTYDLGPDLWLALEPKFYPFVTEFAFSDIFSNFKFIDIII